MINPTQAPSPLPDAASVLAASIARDNRRRQRARRRREDRQFVAAIVAVAFVASIIGSYVAGEIVARRQYAQDYVSACPPAGVDGSVHTVDQYQE